MSVRLTCNNFYRITSNILLSRLLQQPHVLQLEHSSIPILTSKYHSKFENEFTRNHSTKIKSIKLNNSEEENLLFMKNDPDKFGTTAHIRENDDPDPGDVEEEEYIQNPPRASQKLDLKEYAKMIKQHLENNQIKEAVDVLETRMLKEDRVKPGKHIFKLLISGCAKAGYSKKAFQLYNKMKQRGLLITPGVYTSLFNACANAPWQQDGLNKANRLREIMLEKGYNPNVFNYNAMIKAYGRCGDIKTAYQLADEMMEKKMKINTETFNFLLQACASDNEFGFRHALLTWHKMLNRNIQPDIYTFGTMLRCVRDCSIGDLETMEEVLMQILSKSQKRIDEKTAERNEVISQTQNEIESANETDHTEDTIAASSSSSEVTVHQTFDETPNLLCSTPHLGSLISISEVKNPEDRLLLLGGFMGFLDEMKKAKITPGIEIFTTLLEVIPPTIAAEKKLISLIRKIGLKADIDFFNILIKKRSMRFDYAGAQEVLNMIKTARLQPDIITYGVLALGCQTREDARELLNVMREKGIRINIQILGAMLRQGCAKKNFKYVNEILQITLDEKIKPNEEFLKHLDNFNKGCQKMIQQKHPATRQKSFQNGYTSFREKLNMWNEEWEIGNVKLEDAIKKIKEHPFAQFREGQAKGFEHDKNEKLLKKQKIRQYIKRIKIKDEPGDEQRRINFKESV